MKPKLCSLASVLVAIKFVTCLEESFSDSNEPQEAKNQHQQQGSWAHWWSYDGISGPDYWNINKRWRLCSLGRKQSPVNIRTERLVYDHLLGPIHLNWSQHAQTDKKSTQVRVRLLNSGRGVEAWLPEAQSQLILSRGPLSYDYSLFKIELHSAPTTTTTTSSLNQRPTNELEQKKEDEDEEDEREEGAADYLRSGKSSEHLIDGRAFEAELQLHFYNKRLASSAYEAQQLAGQDEGRPSLFAAISVFLVSSTSHEGKSGVSSSPVDELILNNLGSLANQGDALELLVDREQLERLVPERRHYITYQGSMNRPPCSEALDWIISNRPLRMDPGKFRQLFEKLNTNQENIRPAKALNRRLLRTTINNLSSGLLANNNRQQQQQQQQQEIRFGGFGSLANDYNINGNELALSNCSDVRKDLKQCQGEAKQVGGGSCSMKPRYVYQLTYGTQRVDSRG